MEEKGEGGFPADPRSAAKSSVLAAAKATGKVTALCRDRAMAMWKEAASMATRASDHVVASASTFNPFEKKAKPAKRAKPREGQRQGPRLPAKAPPAKDAAPDPPDRPGTATAEGSGDAGDAGMPPPRRDPTAQLASLQAEVELLSRERTGAMATVRDLEQEVARLTERTRALEEELAERKAALAGIRTVAATFVTRKGPSTQGEHLAPQERETGAPGSRTLPVGGDEEGASRDGEAAGGDRQAIHDEEAPGAGAAATESGPRSGDVTPDEVGAATFARASEKVMFSRRCRTWAAETRLRVWRRPGCWGGSDTS